MNDSELRAQAYKKMDDLTRVLTGSQGPDGAWRYCFESGTVTDAFMIILLRHLGIQDEVFLSALAGRILSLQAPSGAWKLFYDEPEGNLSATIECYYALLLGGYRKKDDPDMVRVREFILARGGPEKAGSLTKVMLALTGHYPWDKLPKIPVEMILLPVWMPVNFFDLSGYARVHAAPILLCAGKEFSLKLPDGPDLSGLFPSLPRRPPDWQAPPPLRKAIDDTVEELALSGASIHTLAFQKLEQYMLERIEWDGALYSYFTTTFLMIFALLASGYKINHPVIAGAVRGLKNMTCWAGAHYHLQEATSTVWNTALAGYALQEAGLAYAHPAVSRAISYLLARQHTRAGDWQVHNPQGRPGGWGFSDSNTINPDVDDTSYALRALTRQAAARPEAYGPSWRAGLEWLLTMQNDDGGWPAFEKNTDKSWPEKLPIPDGKAILTDPSAADLTGRTLEFLCNYAGMTTGQPPVQKGVDWLLKKQGADGAWYGRWGISYLYGTWAAVTGLVAAQISPQHDSVKSAVAWLLSVQNPDGGWGESCLSDSAQKYTPLGFSTPSQTAWAVDALVIAGERENPAVSRGVNCLIGLIGHNGIEASYPTGAGLPGGFYIHYHSYRYVWPLLALSHYLRT